MKYLITLTLALLPTLIFSQETISLEQTIKELYLNNFNINDSELEFKKLGGSTATNWMVKKDGVPVANLKCTWGNTFHKGAIVMYEFGKELGLDIFPVAIEVLVNRSIRYSYKVNGIKKYRTISKNENCALKEWSSNFAPFFWKVDRETGESSFSKRKLSKGRLAKELNCKEERQSGPFRFFSKSKRSSPSFKDLGLPGVNPSYRGDSEVEAVAKDFSSMMILDAILGNDDRFPGGNIHFRSVVKSYELIKRSVVFNETRLFSIDNESVMRGGKSFGMMDLKKYVSRFDEDFIERLKVLRDRLESTESFVYLNFMTWKTKSSTRDFLLKNIKLVLSHVDRSVVKCGEDAFI